MFGPCGNYATRYATFRAPVTNLEWRCGGSVATERLAECKIVWLIDWLVGMATGCCGVKKQKLNSVVVSTRNGERGLWSKGFINRSSDRSNSVDIQAISRDYGECSSTSNYDRQTLSPRLAGRQPRIVCCDMVVFCFDVLHSYLYSSEPPRTPQFTNDQFPLFVTWKMGKDKKLRGCIGTFNSTSLHDGLREYAVTSACKDSRFEPINANEFARLHCSVSLLMDFEVADHYLDWEIGVHGIRIEFISEKGSKKAATYLPEVAIEQGWNQVQTIDSLLRKGGFKGTITSEIRGSLCLIRFQSEKMTVSYSEYLTHKKLSASATFTKQNLQTVTTILPPLKPPISNGEAALPKNFMNGQLSATCGSPPSIGIHQRDRFSFSHKYRHEHNSQHSLVPPMNGALYEHHPATPSTQWWRNHTTNDQYIHMNGRSQRHPQFDGDSCRGPNHQCILPQTLR